MLNTPFKIKGTYLKIFLHLPLFQSQVSKPSTLTPTQIIKRKLFVHAWLLVSQYIFITFHNVTVKLQLSRVNNHENTFRTWYIFKY